jgi:SulP family sulfate permease
VEQTKYFLVDIWNVVQHIRAMHAISLAFGATAIVMLLTLKKYSPRAPGVLTTVGVLTLASYLFGFHEMGGQVVGEIPRGLPSFSTPIFLDWHSTTALLPAAFLIAIISFMEAMSSCKVIAMKTRTPWNENQELIGQGLAKVASAFSQSIPVSGSFSRSALNLAANGKTGLSSIVSAVFVLITLLFLTPLLFHMPKPVLAAVIITAVFSLVDYGSIVRAWRARKDDGIAATITFISTLVFAPSIQIGILSGVIVSISLLLYRLMRPRVVVLGLHVDGTLRDADYFKDTEIGPHMGAIRFDGSLFFVNVSYFEQAVLKLARSNPNLSYILIAGSGINGIDASGIEMLTHIVDRLKTGGITLVFSGIKPQVRQIVDRTGLKDRIGEQNIFVTEREALDALKRALTLAPARQQASGPAI